MDEIACQLRQEGLSPQPAFMPGSRLMIGVQVELAPYQLVFRREKGYIILCHFQRLPDCSPEFASLVRLWGILRRLFRQSSDLRAVRMLVITDVWDRPLAEQRRQLVRLLRSLGAEFVQHAGERWLEISASRLRQRR